MGDYYGTFIEKANQTVAGALVYGKSTLVSNFQTSVTKELRSINDQDVVEKTAEEEAYLKGQGLSPSEENYTLALNRTLGDRDLADVLPHVPVQFQRLMLIKTGGVNSPLGRDIAKASFAANPVSENSDYQSWDNEKEANLLEALTSDKDIVRLVNKWEKGEISQEEKHVLAETIHSKHAEIYGYQKVDILTLSEAEPSSALKSEEHNHTDAYFSYNKIVYDNVTDRGSYSAETPYEFVNAIIHEGQHAFQQEVYKRVENHMLIEDALINKVGHDELTKASGYKKYDDMLPDALKNTLEGGWNEKLDPHLMKGGALRDVAEGFLLSSENYIESKVDYEGYRMDHRESNAWNMGDNAAKYLSASAAEQKEMLSGLRSEYADHEIENTLPKYTDDQLNMTCSDLGRTL